MLKVLLAFSSLAAIAILLMLITVFVAWLNGGGYVLLPGLGLIVSLPFILFVLSVAEIAVVALTVFLFRRVSKYK